MEKKTEVSGIFKVTDGILINKDNDALQAYKALKKKDMKIRQIEETISELKESVDEIKNLLRGLVK